METACRRVDASWLVSAPVAENMTALATRATAKNRPGPGLISMRADCPVTTMMRAVTAHRVATPPARPANAWTAAPRRVVAPVSRSSHRPESSSPRRSLVLVNRPHTAPRMLNVMKVLKTVNPATVWSCGAGPNSALVALFDPNAAASRSLAAWVE